MFSFPLRYPARAPQQYRSRNGSLTEKSPLILNFTGYSIYDKTLLCFKKPSEPHLDTLGGIPQSANPKGVYVPVKVTIKIKHNPSTKSQKIHTLSHNYFIPSDLLCELGNDKQLKIAKMLINQ